jgi:hypothetical protein
MAAGKPYIEFILRLDALAAGGERRHRAGHLEPFPQVGLELEADVWFGVVALAVPGGGHGVEGLCRSESREGEGDGGGGETHVMLLYVVRWGLG